MKDIGAAKLGSIEIEIDSIVDLMPFGFTNTIRFLMFWSGYFKFHAKIVAFCDKF